MKILYIAPANSIHTYRWVKYFHELGNEIILLSSEEVLFDFSFLKFHSIKTPYKSFKLNMLKGLIQIFNYIRIYKPDIIHVHYLRRIAWIPGLLNLHPLVITPWGSDLLYENAFKDNLSKILTKISFKNSDLVTADSNILLKISTDFGAKNTALITFGAEKKKFFKLDKNITREKIGFDKDSFIILSPRALTPLYNIDKIIEAFYDINKKYKNTRLIILDFNTNKEYKNQILNLIGKLDITDKITIMKDLKHDSLNEIYNISDVLVSVPNTDGTPATFFEAMLCGLPIISINHNSYDEIVTENKDILFINKIDSNLIREKIQDIYTGFINTNIIIKNAFETAEKNSFEIQMNKVQLLYKKLSKK